MAKPVIYDAAVIQEFASRLYRRASSIIATFTVIGLIIGGVAGAAAFQSNGIAILIAAAIGAALGFSIGQERAFKLKLEAQVALCQVQIEKNTSKS